MAECANIMAPRSYDIMMCCNDALVINNVNIVNNAFGKEFSAVFLTVRFPLLKDIEICEIDIKASNKPLYCEMTDRNGAFQKKFYVRSGNSSQELDIEETASYIKTRY